MRLVIVINILDQKAEIKKKKSTYLWKHRFLNGRQKLLMALKAKHF